MSERSIEELIAASSIGAGLRDIEERGIDAHLADLEQKETPLQRESRWVNELQGVVSFLSGVLHEVATSKTIDEAKTCVEMAQQHLAEYRSGLWIPGPQDDPADWNS